MRRFLILMAASAALATAIPARAENMKFLALGDSYTIGEGVQETERWPNQLAATLHSKNIAIDAPEIVARTGWTTDELSDAMDRHTFHPPYALVTLLIGVNNQYRGRDLQNYRDQFSALLRRTIELAGGRRERVIVVSIPDWGVTSFGRSSGRDGAQIAREIDAYNAANAEIATMQHVGYVDVTAASRTGGAASEALVGDGLHPSATMYKRWVDSIEPLAKKALSSH
jgi:lysophospholipase L1-like esterase